MKALFVILAFIGLASCASAPRLSTTECYQLCDDGKSCCRQYEPHYEREFNGYGGRR